MKKNILLLLSFSFAMLSAAITANGAVISESGSGTNIHISSGNISAIAATVTTSTIAEVWCKLVFKRDNTQIYTGTTTSYDDYEAVSTSPSSLLDLTATYRAEASHVAKTTTNTYLYSSYCQLSDGVYTGKCAP